MLMVKMLWKLKGGNFIFDSFSVVNCKILISSTLVHYMTKFNFFFFFLMIEEYLHFCFIKTIFGFLIRHEACLYIIHYIIQFLNF